MIYFIYKTPDFQPALLGCICATVRGCAVFVLPTSLLMEAQVEFVVKAGFLKKKQNFLPQLLSHVTQVTE